ncbi:winged helix-turn-helix transcriptional regulator [Streptomyces sp. NBC_01497]|uniref:winged helix-turn-helix transcriptional regulator n=1 Tax=Streptomyces sp. NBC_01497 TaxID=2903885 RepID=UPI002E34505F|nr:helix-turn-helix domain-containing protein [Streptomyces sp. NBC_01497]
MPKVLGKDSTCSIARSLGVVGDSWTLLIIREALVAGSTRFQEFRDALGVAPNVLTTRLASLVDEGLMTRTTYREQGARTREQYVLTDAGRSLSSVMAALAEWGRSHRPRPDGTSPQFMTADSGATAQLAFVGADGEKLPPEGLVAVRTPDVPPAD